MRALVMTSVVLRHVRNRLHIIIIIIKWYLKRHKETNIILISTAVHCGSDIS